MGWRALLLPLVVSLWWACGGAPTTDQGVTSAGSAERPTPPRLNLLLITVDTLRADALGAYGNSRVETPWMDRLAAEGVRFEGALAHNVVTLPAHASILTGLYPLEHGIRDNAGFRLPNDLPTLATMLRRAGYRTGAFISAFPLDSRFGLDRGFDVYEDSFVATSSRPAFLEQERSGSETVALATRWLEEGGSRPWFCWVHLYEPHFPYSPPEPFRARFDDDPYLGDVAAADAALAPLLAPLLEGGEQSRTLIVLTSDHGEALGDHCEATHGIFAYQPTLRVPLILHRPGLLDPRVVLEPVRHIDLLPTILDILSLPLPEDVSGRSLLPLATGESDGAPPPSYFEALSGQLNRGWAPLYGVVEGDVKFIDLPVPELYDLAADPAEANNLAASQPQRVAALEASLERLRALDVGTSRAPEDAETLERLETLGYLTGRPAERVEYSAVDDPKNLMELDRALREVGSLYERGDLDAALAQARSIVERRPGMRLALVQLGQLERESGHLEAAVEALREAYELQPADHSTLALLGACLTQAGRAGEAIAITAPHSRLTEPDIDVLLVRALRRRPGARARSGQSRSAPGGAGHRRSGASWRSRQSHDRRAYRNASPHGRGSSGGEPGL